MSSERKPPEMPLFLRNGLGVLGLLVTVGSVFAFLFLLALELLAHTANPYVGVLGYLIVPIFALIGAALMLAGFALQRRRLVVATPERPPPLWTVDLSQPAGRRHVLLLAVGGAIVLLFAAIVSYRGYHFTESATFCGQACHQVMKPEFTTYQHSPHARVSCSACHIGPGAQWLVKAKLSGLRQVYAVLFDTFERPIKTPIKNLRPAQETCEQCHWPKKFVGNTDRLYSHFLADASNTPFTVRLLLKVGGGDPTHGPVGGIHWHMNVGNKVEYIATDEQRQTIPWVRVTDPQGAVTEYRTPNFQRAPEQIVRTMDCMDCHNRPSHIYRNADEAVDLALALGQLDRTMPAIKKTCVAVLTHTYATEPEALQGIATALRDAYPNDARARDAITVVQQIYRDNFFPEMKADWKVYPNNLGHKDWPGCFRCHDGEHQTADGKATIKANDCTACHVILAQGSGEQLNVLNAQGHAFAHPGGDIGDLKCHECHTGGHP